MRTGFKTTEFWIMGIAAVLMAVQKAVWPEAPFPEDAFMAIGLWVAARIGEKTLGRVNTDGKRAWATSEFWTTIAFAVVKFIFPELPEETFYMAMLWVFGRPMQKIAKYKSLG